MDDVVRFHTEHPWDMVDMNVVKRPGVDTETILDSHNAANALAVHIYDDFGVGNLRILPGIRHEHITTRTGTSSTGPQDPQVQSIWLPGAGVYYSATEWLGLLASANQGFSPIPPGSPAETVAETAWNYEAGARINRGNSRAEVIGFLSKYDNLAAVATMSSGSSVDLLDQQLDAGKAQVRGIETTAGQAIALGGDWNLDLDASYAYTDARFESSFQSKFTQFGDVEKADILPYVPRHQGAGTITAEHERMMISTKATGRSSMRDVAGYDDEEQTNPIEGLVTFDAAAEYRMGEHWAAYVNGTNVTGKRTIESWRPYGARPNAPTLWMVGIKAKL